MGIEHGVVTKQPGMRSRGDDASMRVIDVDHAVAFESERREVHLPQALARHRFHRVPPKFRDVHGSVSPRVSSQAQRRLA